MSAYVIGSSALWFWRNASDSFILHRDLCEHALHDCPSSARELAALQLQSGLFGSAPIRLMVPDAGSRVSKSLYSYTVASRSIPGDMFCRVRDGVNVCTPELCLLNFAAHASCAKLIQLCMEFCGFYAIDRSCEAGFRTRDTPLCSVESLQAVIDRALPLPGRKKLRACLKHVKGGARSPMETNVYLCACLPKNLGGYGLPQGDLNIKIMLDREGQLYTERRFLECDLCWENEKVVIEYDGHDYHASQPDRARDATKRNTLLTMGYSVFTLTARQVMDPALFDTVMRNVARELKHRIKTPPADWSEKRGKLRAELFTQKRSSSE